MDSCLTFLKTANQSKDFSPISMKHFLSRHSEHSPSLFRNSQIAPFFNSVPRCSFNIIYMAKLQTLLLVSLLAAVTISQTVNLSQIFTPQTLSTLGPEYNDPNFIKLIGNYFGCKTWTDGNCVQCSKGYVFNNNGICCIVDEYCQQFNTAVGICEICYTGYSVSSNGSCQVTTTTPSNAGCATWKNNVCTNCSVRYFFNADNVCTPVSDYCRQWNTNGQCTSCYHGYELVNGSCVVDSTPILTNQNSNPLCSAWNSSVCISCANRAYFNTAGICTAVSDHCNTWDRLNGACLSCYRGYDLNNGSCVNSPSNTAAPSDPGCKTWENNLCKECSTNWVFNPTGVCIPVSDLCKTSDGSGNCLTCYHGYDLNNGTCVFSPSNNAKPTDGGCKTWDWNNAICLECSSSWVFNENRICIPVNDQCRTNDKSGLCTSCYKGYDLVNGSCLYSPSNNAPLDDAGCKIWDYSNNKCSVCSHFWFFQNGACAQVSSLCQTFDITTGACLSCYTGYDLVNGACVFSPSNNAAPADAGCKTWVNGTCKECSNYFAFNANGVCTAVSDQCKTYEGLSCTSCFNGFTLVNGSCIFSPFNPTAPTDAGCSVWDWNKQICLSCSPYWYFANGVCTPVSDLCKTYDSKTGACLTCYLGYDLTNGSCLLSTKYDKPTDAGCSRWDWTNQVCISCSPYWVMLNGTCQSVSAYCKTYDSSGACTSCFSGYALSNGACQVSNTLCRSQDSNGACLSCFTGYVLYQGKCSNINGLANIALYYAACCPEKLEQLKAEGRIPQ